MRHHRLQLYLDRLTCLFAIGTPRTLDGLEKGHPATKQTTRSFVRREAECSLHLHVQQVPRRLVAQGGSMAFLVVSLSWQQPQAVLALKLG